MLRHSINEGSLFLDSVDLMVRMQMKLTHRKTHHRKENYSYTKKKITSQKKESNKNGNCITGSFSLSIISFRHFYIINLHIFRDRYHNVRKGCSLDRRKIFPSSRNGIRL